MDCRSSIVLVVWMASAASAVSLALASPAAAAGPPTPKPPPRLAAPADQAQATQPGDLRPEHPVVPQLEAPLKRDPGASAVPPPNGRVPMTTLNRRLARCRQLADDIARIACQRREESAPPTPGR